jgi:hypothetical protein
MCIRTFWVYLYCVNMMSFDYQFTDPSRVALVAGQDMTTLALDRFALDDTS